MNQKIRILRDYGLWAIDIVAVLFSYWIASVIRYHGNHDYGSRMIHYMICVIFLLYCTAYAFGSHWHRDFLRSGWLQELLSVLRYEISMIVVTLILVFFAHWSYGVSRIVILVFAVADTAITYVLHLLYRRYLHHKFTNDDMASRMCVVAEREMMSSTIDHLLDAPEQTYRIVAGICPEGNLCNEQPSDDPGIANAQAAQACLSQTAAIRSIPIYTCTGSGRSLTHCMIQIPFDEVFLNAPHIPAALQRELVDGFEEMGATCHCSLALLDISGAEKAGS